MPWSSTPRALRQRAPPTAAADRSACAADARWSWLRVCSLNRSRCQAQFLLCQCFAWRLYRGLAGAPVLLVLSALSRVAAFNFGGVGSRHRDLDGPLGAERSIRFRMHRQNAEAGIRRRL